jgi:hypothetical protein
MQTRQEQTFKSPGGTGTDLLPLTLTLALKLP